MGSLSDGAGDTIHRKFTTRAFSTGIPTTLAGSPVVSVYKDASTTESVAGVTLAVDFDSRTGLNHVSIDTSADGTFYSNGSHFELVITTGTVGGTSVVGEVVGSFDLRPSIGLSTGGVNVTQIAGQTAAAAGTVTFPGTIASTTNITAGTITTTTNLTNLPAITTDWIAAAGISAAAVTKIQAGLSTYAGGAVASVTAPVTLDKTQTLSAARDVSAVADTSLTLNDAFHCAIAAAAGKESVVGTAYTVKTPSTGTVLRTFTLDAATNPASRN